MERIDGERGKKRKEGPSLVRVSDTADQLTEASMQLAVVVNSASIALKQRFGNLEGKKRFESSEQHRKADFPYKAVSKLQLFRPLCFKTKQGNLSIDKVV